jgi:hypothetical protein
MDEIMAETIMCEDSVDSIYELFYKNGWTDGLPIIPPTKERVDAMMSTVERPATECVAQLRPKMGDATVKKLAINAVMAGCLPSYFPIIVAAVEALADPIFNLYSINTTTNPTTPMLIVNGPVRHQVDMNCSWGVMGPGWRANATIGRAISLIMLNIAGRIPGEVSKAVIGHPGRYGMCTGEREEESPWEPLHVERGFQQGESTVTVMSPCGVHSLEYLLSSTAGPLLTNLAGGMHLSLTLNTCPSWGVGEVVLIMCPDHARILEREGFSKQDVKQYFCEHIQIPHRFFCEATLNKMALLDKGELRQKMIKDGLVKEGQTQVTDKGVSLFARPDQLLIVVAGGDGRLHSAYCPTFGQSYAVTRPIKLK